MKNAITALGVVVLLAALLAAGYMFGQRGSPAPGGTDATGEPPAGAQPSSDRGAAHQSSPPRSSGGSRQAPPAVDPGAAARAAQMRAEAKKASQEAQMQQARDQETAQTLAGSTLQLGDRTMTMSSDGNLTVDGQPAGTWKVVDDNVHIGTSDGVSMQARMKDGQLVGSDGAVLSGK